MPVLLLGFLFPMIGINFADGSQPPEPPAQAGAPAPGGGDAATTPTATGDTPTTPSN